RAADRPAPAGLPGPAVRRRAAAGGDRPRAGEPSRDAAGRRADRRAGQRHRRGDRPAAARPQPVRSDAGARHPQPGPGRAVRQPHDRARRRPDRRRRRRGGTAVRAAPVFRAVSGGVTRRKVQTVVIFTVLLVSTASPTLALGLRLLLDANDRSQHAFAAQRGADVTASIDAAKVTAGQLAATRRLPQVTAAAGPFAEATITPRVSAHGGITLPPATVAGRAS